MDDPPTISTRPLTRGGRRPLHGEGLVEQAQGVVPRLDLLQSCVVAPKEPGLPVLEGGQLVVDVPRLWAAQEWLERPAGIGGGCCLLETSCVQVITYWWEAYGDATCGSTGNCLRAGFRLGKASTLGHAAMQPYCTHALRRDRT